MPFSFVNTGASEQLTEIGQAEFGQETLVKGRLSQHRDAWKEMGASQFVLDTISQGYEIPFFETPPVASFRNNRSALQHKAFVSDSIQKLLKTGRIVKTINPTVVNPLTVCVSGDKKRLILDLRYVNAYIWKEHVKFEDWKTFQN